MTVTPLKIAGKEYVVVPRKEFERLRRKASLLTEQDAADATECLRRLDDPMEKRAPWSKVKRRAGVSRKASARDDALRARRERGGVRLEDFCRAHGLKL